MNARRGAAFGRSPGVATPGPRRQRAESGAIESAAAESDPATVAAWAAAGSKALQLVKDALSD